MFETIMSPVRKCGKRKPGTYLVGGTEGSPDGVLDRFTLLHPPVPYNVKLHRTPRLVDSDAILERRPLEDWWVGSSQKTEEKKAGDAWALETFGMPITKRIEVGECQGAKTPEEALAVLVNQVKWDNRIIKYFREMTISKVQEIALAAPAYNQFHENILRHTQTQTVGTLMGAQAALWRMAYAVPPSKRQTYIPNIARTLVVMGLTKDAAAMQHMFKET